MSSSILLSGHPASDLQAAIFAAVADPTSGSRMIVARAGSGKTTTIKNALRHLPPGRSAQLFAFNTDAARQLKVALDELIVLDGRERYAGVRAGTFHSVGYGTLLRHFGVKAEQAKPDDGKVRKILKDRLVEADRDLYAGFVRRLLGYARGEGIGALVPDEEWRWHELVEHHGLYLDSDEASPERGVEIARKALSYSNALAKERKIVDFDDLLYLPLLWKLRLWRNDDVFVDEAQDTNPVRRALARVCLKPGGRLFGVGDDRQSIYGFTGASVDAMDLLREEFGAIDLPLTVSYRCARAVVLAAQHWVPDIEPASGAPEGEVLRLPEEEGLARLTADDAVLCRQTAPLISLAYRQIASGRAVRVLGREIGEGLVDLVRAQRARGVDRLEEKLWAYQEREAAKATARGDEAAAEAVADRVECIMTCIRALPATERTVPGLERRIMALFETLGHVLTLSTIHKAKGLEWPQVAILRPELLPSKWARQPWAIAQEENLQYVAATRAKDALLYLQSEG